MKSSVAARLRVALVVAHSAIEREIPNEFNLLGGPLRFFGVRGEPVELGL